MKKVLLISGSPRKGNVEFVLSELAKKLEGKKELVLLRKEKIKYCLGCLNCYEKSECIINDDMSLILDKLKKTNVLILGTPNYFETISALTKNFIDRTLPFYPYKEEILKDKKIFLICTSGKTKKFTKENMKAAIYGFVYHHKMKLIDIFTFNALYPNDLAKRPKTKLQINKIAKGINKIK